MSDVYEFAKSNHVQGVTEETPYVSKQWQYLNDINSSVYSNNGISLVQFDLSSLYRSDCFVDISQGYFVVPITYVQAFTSNFGTGALVAPAGTGGDSFRLGLKSGFFNLVHACELLVNGQTLESYQPYLNAYTGFKLLSQMSQDDLNTLGPSLGMGKILDNPQSLKFNNTSSGLVTGAYLGAGVSGPVGGNGLWNNAPFATTPDFGDQAAYGVQNTNAYNNGLFSRLNRIVDLQGNAGNSANSLYGSIVSGNLLNGGTIQNTTNCNNEFRPTFQLIGNYMVWYDYAVIRMCDLLDSMNKMPLVKRFDGIVRLSLNVGTVGCQTLQTGTAGNFVTSAVSNSFTNTCPLVVTQLNTAPPATTVGVVSGLFIGRATNTTIFNVNLGASNASNPMNACRFYFPQVVLKPERALQYISENRNKQICYTSMLYNQASNITTGSSYSALIQSGVSNIRGVLILPFVSSSTHGSLSTGTIPVTGISSFSELVSPFDMAPMQTPPISLINLSIAVGGQNVMQNFTSFTFENFLEQVTLYDKINATQMGLSCGLISQYGWENSYRSYYVDCSRGLVGDSMTPRNVNITFTNNSQQTIDCLFFIEYYNAKVVDVETGIIR